MGFGTLRVLGTCPPSLPELRQNLKSRRKPSLLDSMEAEADVHMPNHEPNHPFLQTLKSYKPQSHQAIKPSGTVAQESLLKRIPTDLAHRPERGGLEKALPGAALGLGLRLADPAFGLFQPRSQQLLITERVVTTVNSCYVNPTKSMLDLHVEHGLYDFGCWPPSGAHYQLGMF